MRDLKLFLLAVLFLVAFGLLAWQAVIAPTIAALGLALPF